MRQIFYNDMWEKLSKNGKIVLCGYYQRYWNADKTRNQAFDMFSGRILDVKEKTCLRFLPRSISSLWDAQA